MTHLCGCTEITSKRAVVNQGHHKDSDTFFMASNVVYLNHTIKKNSTLPSSPILPSRPCRNKTLTFWFTSVPTSQLFSPRDLSRLPHQDVPSTSPHQGPLFLLLRPPARHPQAPWGTIRPSSCLLSFHTLLVLPNHKVPPTSIWSFQLLVLLPGSCHSIFTFFFLFADSSPFQPAPLVYLLKSVTS